MKKEKWVRPVLIVLTRSESAEMVLSGCKQGNTGASTGTPDGYYTNCISNMNDPAYPMQCARCWAAGPVS